jgi:hypothetical protein
MCAIGLSAVPAAATYRASGFVLWHYPEAFEGVNEFRSLRCCGPVLLTASSSLHDPNRTKTGWSNPGNSAVQQPTCAP